MSVRARVVSVDYSTGQCVASYDLSPVNFHVTTFHSIPARWPIVGDAVTLVFNDKRDLLAVHLEKK